MRFHLFWLDKNWEKRGDCANNYNLIVDMENKTYKVYTNAFYGYYNPDDIEVKKKSDIEDYIEYLKRNGFTEMEWQIMINREDYDFTKGNELYNKIVRVLTDFENKEDNEELNANEADMYETLCEAQNFLEENFEWISR